MTSFSDGPAAGQTLLLKRAPRFLRVTFNGSKWDALDQLADRPEPHEELFAYERSEYRGTCHMRFARGGGFYCMAEYKLVPEQPTDAEMRSQSKWEKWAEGMAAE